ncbi:MAG: hypothetical protein ACKOAR_07195, partial [Bacteroidota bacterium]
MLRRYHLILIALAIAGGAAGQEQTLPGLAVYSRPDTILTHADSLYIFTLLDSLMENPLPDGGSQWLVRTGYNSNITATGRPFALGNYGLSGGVGYLHKSGFYTDISGYWSGEYTPSYFLTTATAGYMIAPHRNWTLAAEYSRFWYNLSDETYIAYTNSLNATAFWHKGLVNLRTDYALYFGEKTGHRLSPTIALDLSSDNRWSLDKLRLMPMATIMFGTESVTSYVAYSTNPLVIRERIRRGLPLFYQVNETKAGIMNYSF